MVIYDVYFKNKRVSDNDTHKKLVRRGVIVATIFSIGYGFYEYFIVDGLLYISGPGGILNWFIMF